MSLLVMRNTLLVNISSSYPVRVTCDLQNKKMPSFSWIRVLLLVTIFTTLVDQAAAVFKCYRCLHPEEGGHGKSSSGDSNSDFAYLFDKDGPKGRSDDPNFNCADKLELEQSLADCAGACVTVDATLANGQKRFGRDCMSAARLHLMDGKCKELGAELGARSHIVEAWTCICKEDRCNGPSGGARGYSVAQERAKGKHKHGSDGRALSGSWRVMGVATILSWSRII